MICKLVNWAGLAMKLWGSLIYPIIQGSGLRVILSPLRTMENQMEKKIEAEMNTEEHRDLRNVF